MTDAEIVRWLAEKVMGWTEQPQELWNSIPMSVGQFRMLPSGLRTVGKLGYWTPLTDPRDCAMVMREQGYGYLIRHPANSSAGHTAEIFQPGSRLRSSNYYVDQSSWTRALCLAAVLATGGEV